MHSLKATLADHDPAMLPVLAQVWAVEIENLDRNEMVEALTNAMLTTEKLEVMWASLDDAQRGAMQTLLGSGAKMLLAMFERLFGQIRKMGVGRIEREQPHFNPASTAEALYYKGLIATHFEQGSRGLEQIAYIPTDLAAVLPSHKTAYDDLPADELTDDEDLRIEPIEEVSNPRQADTSIVDDLTTLLVYLQVNSADIEGETLAPEDRKVLLPHLLVPDELRLAFMVGVGVGASLIEIQEGRAYPRRTEVRRWLNDPRHAQIRWLAEKWLDNTVYRDLWHVPGLYPEPTGWPYNPVVAREEIIEFLHSRVPQEKWWGLEDFIFAVKTENSDFQRPGGDYDSWYIRNEAGEYLRGFQSWDAVEGALLEYYIMGPMHWLGLVDLAEDAARLTAYGRAFAGKTDWPTPTEQLEYVVVQADGTLRATRRVSRFDRFQLARFTTWDTPATLQGAPYIYRLSSEGIQIAAQQGINTQQIATFIARMLGSEDLPPAMAKLLETWQGGAQSEVTLERLLVLRTTSIETMDYIFNTPAFRRYLGARLGPMACAVRADQWEMLRDALGEKGIVVTVRE